MGMAKVVVTFSENEDGSVNVETDWGENGPDPKKEFHTGVNRILMALDALYGTGEAKYIDFPVEQGE